MITVYCRKCDRELNRPGALLFSDPDGEQVLKYHLCKHCWLKVVSWLNQDAEWGQEKLV